MFTLNRRVISGNPVNLGAVINSSNPYSDFRYISAGYALSLAHLMFFTYDI